MWNSKNITEKELIWGESIDLRSIQYFHLQNSRVAGGEKIQFLAC